MAKPRQAFIVPIHARLVTCPSLSTLFVSFFKYVAFVVPILFVLPELLPNVWVIIFDPMLNIRAVCNRHSSSLVSLLVAPLVQGQAKPWLCHQVGIRCCASFGKFPHHLPFNLGFLVLTISRFVKVRNMAPFWLILNNDARSTYCLSVVRQHWKCGSSSILASRLSLVTAAQSIFVVQQQAHQLLFRLQTASICCATFVKRSSVPLNAHIRTFAHD